jgi:hypothetical protein
MSSQRTAIDRLKDVASRRTHREVPPVKRDEPLRDGDTLVYNPWSAPNEAKPTADAAFAEGQRALADLYRRQQAERRERKS